MTQSLMAFDLLPESALRNMVDLMVRLIEACGAVVIMIGAIVAIVKFAVTLARRDINQFSAVRLSLARFLVLGLEFQLAADVLRTAISPSFQEIGKLAAIATIRTVLNYFLNREIAQEQREIESTGRDQASAPDRRISSADVNFVVNASWCFALAGIALGIGALVVFRQPLLAMRVMLDLFVAAGLLRLSVDTSWAAIASIVAVIALRRMVTRILTADSARAPTTVRPLRPAWLPSYTLRRSLSFASSAVTTSSAMLWL